MLRISAGCMTLLASAVLAVGCGSSNSSSTSSTTGSSTAADSGAAKDVKVDVGTSQNVTLPSKGMRISIFMNSQTNAYQKQVVAGARAKAKQTGDTLTLYDAGFDPAKQLNQIQNAIQKKSLDAAMILPVDSHLMCNAGTKMLPNAGIPAIALAIPFCGHESDTGPASWSPGSLSYVGGNNTIDAVKALLSESAKALPGKQTVLLVAGPAVGGQAKTLAKIAPEFTKANPDFNVKYTVNTDYTTPDALAKVQAALRAHPDITSIVSVYSPDMTRGAIEALSSAGKLGKIKVADAGGSKYSYAQVAKGNVAMTIPFFPFSQGARGVEALNLAATGKAPARFIDESTFGSQAKPIVITKANMAKYPPTY